MPLLVLLLAPALAAQPQSPSGTGTIPAQTTVPTIAFTLDFPGSDPDHYTFRVTSDGRAAYESSSPLPNDGGKDTFQEEFTLSAPTCKKIFDLAARARFFESDLELKKRNLASTGTKILTYQDAQRSTRATYNYSQVPAAQELTGIFQNMAVSMEFSRRLQHAYRYQKLALDQELKRMEEMLKSNSLSEVQAVEPVLSKIAADPSVINVVRARAQRLIAAAREASP